MAAGEGRRLRPLTERWPKPVLPIDGRPVVAAVVRALGQAGCHRTTVVTGHLADQVEALLGDGRGFGLELAYARQPEPHGSADAVARGLAAGAEPPLLVATADTLFADGDVAHVAVALEHGPAVAVRRRPQAGGSVDVAGGRVIRIGGSGGPFYHASLWALTATIVPYLEGLTGPPYELGDAYQRAIDDGHEVSAIEVRPTRDLTDPLDLVQENFRYLDSTS
jgi:dTDP-glucose pyrophosphorylase